MASVSEIYIRGTAADPDVAAQREFVARGDEVQAELGAKVAMAGLCLSARDWDTAREELVRFCRERLLEYLAITDRVLYVAAVDGAMTRLLVRGLRTQHRLLAQYVADLERAANHDQVTESGHALVALVAACLEVERTVLLPALAVQPGVDLPSVVADVRTLDRGGELTLPECLDVREIPHGQRHPRIFGVYTRLRPGGSFVLVNNHDPKPLRREFDSAYPDQFGWEYLQRGPEVWQVRISRRRGPAHANRDENE